MEVRYLPSEEAYQRMTTKELREMFVFEKLFAEANISTVYCDADRAIVGGVVPTNTPLKLLATRKEMSAAYFAERRELGIVNIGGEGIIRIDGTQYSLSPKDMLYVGRGAKDIEFSSVRAADASVFFFVSFPAHTSYPVALIRATEAEKSHIGAPSDANKRTISKYIHMGGARSCQLVMGLTDLEVGSVWNTMPPHTHMRRMEIYLYFGLGDDAAVMHLMGKPDETRSIVMRNHHAVISPSWSIHCGAGTKSYSFIWAMGGENQEFADMDAVPIATLQ
jgi:4-deoxy-L-threo-5-hexosulose-uronate ketol-isomerase